MEDVTTARPAWQTDDLLDEWPDDDEPTTSSHSGSRSSVSFTVPVGSIRVHGTEDGSPNAGRSSPDDTDAAGTFLIRHDAPAAILPKTPGKNAIKDFFSPLPLERMFEPPSPPQNSTQPPPLNPSAPAVPSRLSQAHRAASFSFQDEEDVVQSSQTVELQENEIEMAADDGLKPDMNCQFTFNVPRHTPSNALTPSGTGFPQAQSTPGRPSLQIPSAPQTDPRLRLFQFQYDTFTRDHLSAMVDSIAVNSPSTSNTGNLTPAGSASSPFALSRVSDLTPCNSDARSAKRVKLSPVSDYGEGEGAGAVIQRPQLQVPLQRDYVGESRSLMAQIKQQARDFSTISTVASAQSPAARADRTPHQTRADPPTAARQSALSVPVTADSDASVAGSSGSKRTSYSSLGYREQAANLMAQIKNDMKGAKRLFSVDTDASRTRADVTEASQSFLSDGRSLVQDPSRSARRPHHPPSPRDKGRGTRHASRTVFRKPDSSADDATSSTDAASAAGSMDTSQLYAQFPAPPIVVAPAPTPPRAPSPVSQPNPRAHPPPAATATANMLSSGYPSSSLRSRANEDLNRFVSSSTAGGTTLTAGSAASFVKHAGPAQITRIAPEDVPALPERVGRMVFDKVMMRWVKATAEAVRVPGPVSDGGYAASAEGDSEDPFRDIESLREEDSGEDGGLGLGVDPRAVEMSRIEEVEDEEEVELTSFSFDGPSQHMLQILNGDAGAEDGLIIDDDETTDSDHDDAEVTELTQMSASMSLGAQGAVYGHDPQLDDDDGPTQILPNPSDSFLDTPVPPAATSTPLPSRANTSGPVRSVLKSTSVTPVSALKNGSLRHRTPANRHRHRRSVSFSDGKREGQIQGLGRASDDSGSSDGDVLPAGTASFVPSARSKRIADMMEDLADTSVDDDSPSKTGNSGRPASDEMQPLATRWPLDPPVRHASAEVSHRANGTFLTEASFGVAHDKLVQVITDVQPFEPYWEDLSSIDLSGKHIESVARLKEFLPRLDSLALNCNQLSWLSGVPTTVRMLSIADNALTRVTSFNHLLGLENLDVSRNNIDSLKQLECLRHLRELRADGNRIRDLDGLQGMDGLVKLSLQGNCIAHAADFDGFAWTRLEVLNLSRNRIERVSSLGSLPSLIVLNLDNNWITDLDAHGTLGRLRILRLSANKLKALDVAPYPNLRTLYADNNFIVQVTHARTLSRLENLSLRNQGTKGLSLSIRDVRDVRRLYLSGNPLPPDFLSEACYNLIYLEIAACRLSALPPRMAALVPNLRVLNLNYNFLEDVRPLEGLRRLSKLTIIGSRLKGTKGLLRVLKGAPDMEMVDFRMNPCTLGWYLPLLVKDVPGALQPSEPGQRPAAGAGAGSASWQELDAKFRRDLPDAAYVGRLAYRGLVMQACARVKMLDGVLVTRKEQDKAARFLEGVGRARGAGPG